MPTSQLLPGPYQASRKDAVETIRPDADESNPWKGRAPFAQQCLCVLRMPGREHPSSCFVKPEMLPLSGVFADFPTANILRQPAKRFPHQPSAGTSNFQPPALLKGSDRTAWNRHPPEWYQRNLFAQQSVPASKHSLPCLAPAYIL